MPVQFPWLPVGHALPDGTLIGGIKTDGTGYQIVRSRNSGKTVLLVEGNTRAAQRNLSTTLRHRRFLFTDSFLLLWKWRVG